MTVKASMLLLLSKMGGFEILEFGFITVKLAYIFMLFPDNIYNFKVLLKKSLAENVALLSQIK